MSQNENLEDVKQEKKEDTLKDIQNLDKIYLMLLKAQFKDQKLYSLIDKISDLINKEIKNKITQNNITHKEYEEIIDKSYIVEMEKDEMIRFYANKIVYDCITDCSENNRIFSVDEYANNDFIIKNFAEIVKRINLDERINDLEVDNEKKEIDMVFYLEYCPHCYQENLDISNNDRIKHLKKFESFMCDLRAYTPARWFRTNTRELINDYYTNRCDSDEEKKLVYNLLNEE